MEKPLVKCPACQSRLIYPVAIDPGVDGGVIIERRCPECEYLDIVTTGKLAATVWVRRERRIRDALVRTVLELELDSVLGTPNPTVF